MVVWLHKNCLSRNMIGKREKERAVEEDHELLNMSGYRLWLWKERVRQTPFKLLHTTFHDLMPSTLLQATIPRDQQQLFLHTRI